jgi:preprotein translocase subunit SecG
MSLLVIFLSVLLFLDCVLLICLILLQLPKKEAGAGLAFGGAATDALFGAGSGNVLTKITKYVAGAFFALALILAILSAHVANESATSALIKALGAGSSGSIPLTSPSPLTPSSSPAPSPESKPAPSSGSMPFLQLTNAPAPANATSNK